MKNTLTVTSAKNGLTFNVRIVNPGDGYGLITDGVYALTNKSEMALVEFYDARYPHTEFGQFVSRYWMDTLAEHTPGEGLNLDGGIPDWKVDGPAMDLVIAWLKLNLK